MLIDRAKKFLIMLACTLLAACGGGSGGMVNAATGTLSVILASSVAGVAGAAKVTGPANFARDLDRTSTLTGLVPGNYTITAASVANGKVIYPPTPATQTVTVAGDASATARVDYAVPLSIGLRQVASGLAEPVFMTSPAGDSRQFIVERAGRIRILQDGVVQTTPFLDISAQVDTAGEGGLLSMAFHPEYASNGFFFIYYSNPNHNIVVERLHVSLNPGLADPGSAMVIIAIPHPAFVNHYGGLVSFGPDKLLYLGTGDGGGIGDPQGNAQNLGSLLGKILRLDVSAASFAQPYVIPATNPFAGQAGRRGEIWSYGLRNPWRYTFDNALLYIADVGQERREEVDVTAAAPGGLNFGWNIMEGSLCYLTVNCVQTGLTLPAFEYDNGANNCSITGGYVYRGKAIPELAGHYFYSDYCGGFLKSFLSSGGATSLHADWQIPDIGRVLSFGRDADGELYLLSERGAIYKIGKTFAPRG